jgi:hypothetical protein
MSTYQPPGGQPPEGTPTYAQPQDPWAHGQDHGLASVPTDPIPQQYGPYAHGVGSEVWSQPTVLHGVEPYEFVPQPRRGKAGLIAVVVLAVVVLGGGGGFAAWYVTSHNRGADPNASNTAAARASTGAPAVSASFDPHDIKEGDCIVNKGSLTKPLVALSSCSAGSFKVVRKVRGALIKENASGEFDAETTSISACAGIRFESWYGYKDVVDDKKDLFFCLTNNK